MPSGGSVSISRTQAASPPIGGTFSASFAGETITGLKVDLSDREYEDSFKDDITSMGFMEVKRIGDCANFDLKVEFLTNPGDQELITVDGSGLTGVNVVMTSSEVVKGHLNFDPIPGESLRTIHKKPQVF